MRVLFLITAFIPFILTVQAQKNFSQYLCAVKHKHSKNTFYLNVPSIKEVEVGGWKVYAGIRRDGDEMTVSLRRVVNVMDANYQREAKRTYPLTTKKLQVELEHDFGGRTDEFEMSCSPRD